MSVGNFVSVGEVILKLELNKDVDFNGFLILCSLSTLEKSASSEKVLFDFLSSVFLKNPTELFSEPMFCIV